MRRDALLAHETQVDPDVAVLVRPARARSSAHVHPFDDYILARSLVDHRLPEDDLFAGITLTAASHARVTATQLFAAVG